MTTAKASTGDCFCKVCGYRASDPPWGADGRTPLFEHCPCCGVEWGYQDATLSGVQRFRSVWLSAGAPWRDRTVASDGLDVVVRLQQIEVSLPA